VADGCAEVGLRCGSPKSDHPTQAAAARTWRAIGRPHRGGGTRANSALLSVHVAYPDVGLGIVRRHGGTRREIIEFARGVQGARIPRLSAERTMERARAPSTTGDLGRPAGRVRPAVHLNAAVPGVLITMGEKAAL